MNLELDGKKALVTGSTAGIGFAIAKALAAEGARVIVNGRTDARVNEAIASSRAEIPSAKLEAIDLDLYTTAAGAEAAYSFSNDAIPIKSLSVTATRAIEDIS